MPAFAVPTRPAGRQQRHLRRRLDPAALPAQGAGAAGDGALGRGGGDAAAVRPARGRRALRPERAAEARRGAVPHPQGESARPLRKARRRGHGQQGVGEGDPRGVQEGGTQGASRPLQRRDRGGTEGCRGQVQGAGRGT
eukprot:5349183-Prymnesium_polylepis.1